MLLSNNVLLTIAMGAVLLGTLYPLVLDTLNLGKISVGPPYFDAVFFPLMAPAVFLMAIGPLASWKKAELPDLATRLKWALGVAVACAIIVPLAKGKWSSLVAFGLFLAFWVVAATAVQFGGAHAEARRRRRSSRKLRSNSASWYGMQLAHLGVAAFIIGVAMVKGFETERDVRMAPGDKVELGGYEFTFTGTRELPGPNYAALQGDLRGAPPGRAGSREEDVPREAHLPGLRPDDDRGRHRRRHRRRPLRLAWASRSRGMPGACASTTSPSSTGSGADAC